MILNGESINASQNAIRIKNKARTNSKTKRLNNQCNHSTSAMEPLKFSENQTSSMNKHIERWGMENEDKTKFTLEHAKAFFQTFAEIEAEIHAPNVEIIAKVKEK